MVDPRIAERRAELRAKQRRRRLRRTLIAVFMLALAGGSYALDRAGWFDIVDIAVIGVDRSDAAAIRSAAAIEPGTSTLRIRTSRAQRQVEALPLIRRADVARDGIDRISITVEERRPVLEVVGTRRRALVDRDGIIIDEVAGDEVFDLPQVHLRGTPPELGMHVAEHRGLANAFDAWRGLSGPLRADVVAYHVMGSDDVTVELRRGTRVRIGRAERMPEKVRAIGAVLADLGEISLDLIDVRAPSAPVIMAPDL